MKNNRKDILISEGIRFCIYTPIACLLLYFCGLDFSNSNLIVIFVTLAMYRFMYVSINPDNTIKMDYLYKIILITLILDIINYKLHLDIIEYFVILMMMFLVAYGMWRFDINNEEEKRKKIK